MLFLGDAPDDLAAKVAQGIKDWRPENVIGKLSLPSCQAQMDLPEMSLEVTGSRISRLMRLVSWVAPLFVGVTSDL